MKRTERFMETLAIDDQDLSQVIRKLVVVALLIAAGVISIYCDFKH